MKISKQMTLLVLNIIESLSYRFTFLPHVLYCVHIFSAHAQTLTCQVNGGVVPCPPAACPGDQVTFTLTTPALVANNLWVLPSGSCSNSTTPDSIVLSQIQNTCRAVTMTCGPFTVSNVDPGANKPCLTSTLTVTVNSSMTSSLIKVGTQDVSAQNNIMNTTQIMVIGKNVILSMYTACW